jgi:2',3'-cyclic-nucleotide 2'-phosphodiesterase (5'-nucleotidase family)/predicted AlkP superfamily phosphohydrolase/phosphomutase
VARSLIRRLAVVLAIVGVLASTVVAPVAARRADHDGGGGHRGKSDNAVFFASDGLRQDLVARYGSLGLLPTMNEMLRKGTFASGNGLLTQAPPNTGAGWYSLATGAWPGVHASTNNTFHIIGGNFANSTSAFASGVLKAESIAQAAERGGLRVAQVEWAGGANASIQGPTIDFQTFASGRGVSTNFVGKPGDVLFDDPAFIGAFGLQFDTPAGLEIPGPAADIPPFPAAAPTDATGWSGSLPKTFSPAKEMRLRVLDAGTDKYGLNAWIFDSTNDGKTNYDKVLFSRTKSAADAVAVIGKGVFADVKVKAQGGALDGKTAGMLIRVEELTPDLSRVRLFHTSVSRANASWPTWKGEPNFTGDFAEFLAQKFPTSTAADFAILESGVTSEETYVEQGLYWATGHQPMLRYVMKTYKPDLALVGVPTTDEFQHQFLSLVTKTLPNGDPNPAYDDVDLNGVPDGRAVQRERFIRTAYMEADETLEMARRLAGGDPVTFVASDHGFAPQFLAIDASKPLVDLGLLSRPQTSNCRTPVGETIGSAKACWAGGALQVYLNVAGRDPQQAPPAAPFTQIPLAEVDATVAKIRDAYKTLSDPNDWTHDGKAEGWKVIDRTFTKAEARYIPNGPNSTADMAHPTRTGDLVVFSYPPYQFDAATPGTLIAPSHFFGQHGYVPDVQDLADNINMRATFLADGPGIARGPVKARTIDLAPTLAYILGVPEPQHSQGRVLTEILKGGNSIKPISIVGINDFHGQLEPATLAFDNAINAQVGGAAYLATMFDEDLGALPGKGLILAGGDNVGASPPNSALLDDMPVIDVENAWGLDATSYGNHEFDYGVERLLKHQDRANYPFLATNIVETATGKAPDWVTPSVVFKVDGVKVGVIGAELQTTPDLVSAGATAGLTFLDEATQIKAESQRLRKQGVRVQVVVIHQGTADGLNPIGNAAGVPWTGPILDIADKLQDTTVDAMIVGHTHRISNLMRGDILIAEGINQGTSYSVLQLLVRGGDVDWAGGATRVAKSLGVPPRADVQAIVDDANAQTAVLRNKVIGTQGADIKRDAARRSESALGNLVADAMRDRYPGVEAAWTNSGGIRVDLVVSPPSAGEQPGEITWGEMFAVLPFSNRTVIETLTGAQVVQGFQNGFSAFCDTAINTGRFPQVSGLKVQFHCDGKAVVIDGVWKAPNGPSGTLTLIGPTDTLRFVTNDFMYTGGDGYAVFGQGTNVQQPGDDLLQVAIDYIAARPKITAAVQGRIVGP